MDNLNLELPFHKLETVVSGYVIRILGHDDHRPATICLGELVGHRDKVVDIVEVANEEKGVGWVATGRCASH